MSRASKISRSILVWSYGRGTIQYDIICILILAFIFLVPPSCFLHKKTDRLQPAGQKTKIDTRNEKPGMRP